jgi:hypothetical protein
MTPNTERPTETVGAEVVAHSLTREKSLERTCRIRLRRAHFCVQNVGSYDAAIGLRNYAY